MNGEMELIKALPEVQEIEQSTSSFLTVALSVKVFDEGTCKLANNLFLDADARIKVIDEKLDPKRDLAYRAYQEWLKLIKELKDPYLKGKTYLNGQITVYHQEQERKRQEEMERARQEAIKVEMERRRQEEERRMAEAAALEQAGATEEAEAVMAEALDEVSAPIVIVPPRIETPPVKLMGAAVRETWSAQVFDPKMLMKAILEGKAPENLMEPNMTALNGMARSLKKNFRVPGCRAVPTSKLAATGK